jgi:2-keto-4-pentenoate hydratase/2-oxohepta-3-ene-1,7-dioic acid hydratase in catechol pathway
LSISLKPASIGKQRQNENTGDMIFPVDVLIEHLSKYLTLEEGDLILTGTPPGFDTPLNIS